MTWQDPAPATPGGYGLPMALVSLVVAALTAVLAVEDPRLLPAGRSLDATVYSPPRTPWGDPDLQGSFTNNDERGTPMERPEALAGRRLHGITPAELARLNEERARDIHAEVGRWEPSVEAAPRNSRAWFVVDPPDGRIPPLTVEATRRAAARADSWRQRGAMAPWLSEGLFVRCITRGLPDSMVPAIYGNVYEIVQSPGLVAITYEMINEARLIPLDGRPRVSPRLRSYMGDPRGRFDADTLVVETTNFTDKTTYRGSSENLRLSERFRPLGPDLMEWSVTLTDPSTWTRPWTFAVNLTRTAEGPLEYSCHEGNYALRNILSISRVAPAVRRHEHLK